MKAQLAAAPHFLGESPGAGPTLPVLLCVVLPRLQLWEQMQVAALLSRLVPRGGIAVADQ